MAREEIGSNAQFTGVGVISYLGDYAYIYGGQYVMSTSDQTIMQFVTGKEFMIGKLFVSGAIKTGVATGGVTTFHIKLNGITIILLRVDTAQHDSPLNTKVKLLLPPNSNVEVVTDSNASDSDTFTSSAFVGRLYA